MLSKSISAIKDYYNFRIKSKPRGGHGIHSPFVYDLYTNAIDTDRKEKIFENIEQIKRDLLKDKTPIGRSKFGAGSNTGTRTTTVSSTARETSSPRYLGRLLYRLAKYQKPNTIVELGTSLGISTMYIASGNPSSKVYSIEGDKDLSSIAASSLNKLGITNTNLINGEFDNELPTLLGKLNTFDMAFVDGNHTEEATFRYFTLLSEKANENSMIIFDDIRWSDGMKRAWTNICNDVNISISIDLYRCGIVFFRKGIVKQHFTLRFGPF